jgi:hypothetical protein
MPPSGNTSVSDVDHQASSFASVSSGTSVQIAISGLMAKKGAERVASGNFDLRCAKLKMVRPFRLTNTTVRTYATDILKIERTNPT